MSVLIDSDAFCKLGASDLLADALKILGFRMSDCSRLPALTFMLKKGKLFQAYGESICTSLLAIAENIPPIPEPDPTLIDPIVSHSNIDPGEAFLFAQAAQEQSIVITGDKKALKALKNIDGLPNALAGRIVVMEAILINLCELLGNEDVKRRMSPLIHLDITLSICFSDGNPEPIECLRSYYRSLTLEVDPLQLWEPSMGGRQ